jgi:hypothetical protein
VAGQRDGACYTKWRDVSSILYWLLMSKVIWLDFTVRQFSKVVWKLGPDLRNGFGGGSETGVRGTDKNSVGTVLVWCQWLPMQRILCNTWHIIYTLKIVLVVIL